MSEAAPALEFPTDAFEAVVLRALDAPSRSAIMRAGRARKLAGGALLYRDGDPSDSFFVVLDGSLSLYAEGEGARADRELRRVGPGDTLGEEATLPGLSRRATARALLDSRVAEIPVAVFRRATGREGADSESERERRYLHRAVTRDLVAASALGVGASADELDVLLDAAELRRVRRGLRIYEKGDRAEAFFLLAEGLVELRDTSTEPGSVVAYASRGDFFGEEEALAGGTREHDALAAGDAWCIRVPAQVLRAVVKGNPGVLAQLQESRAAQRAKQAGLVSAIGAKTQVFGDLYRMQVARSLLVIDQESCVRCGHCAWSCSEVHGESRLVRRGDKVLVALARGESAEAAPPSSLSLPNSCQHCRNAACMVDCPTGAISRDQRGEVFIREELCTGCTSCAKACPWDNISMTPRRESQGSSELSLQVATKCDLCRDFEAPACVQACPTESIFRIEPAREVIQLRRLMGVASEGPSRSPRPSSSLSTSFLVLVCAAGLALSLGGVALALQRANRVLPGSALGAFAGALTGLSMLGLLSYLIPKRMVRSWMKRRSAASAKTVSTPRSKTRPYLLAHVLIGLFACVAALAHAGTRVPSSPAGALTLAFWMASMTGVLGGLFYVLIPRRLSLLEGHSALPEDLRGSRQTLLDRLYREASGRGALVKSIVERVLIPYARSYWGSLALALSGRSLDAERQRVRDRVDSLLESRGQGRLEGLDALIEIVVELRATPVRRGLMATLRGWLPVHILAVALSVGLLALHLFMVLLW